MARKDWAKFTINAELERFEESIPTELDERKAERAKIRQALDAVRERREDKDILFGEVWDKI